ncbi:hypothetical protein MCOR21_005214 [Pyricularia oryzae]|nr:hypothetical protein MCOR34_006705 [Pyricularia oryzae]KAI6398513.1 hypothetical protein MCOR24_008823 [Pyricularia oryzae]KAI6429072.1 hypothetical protein MCOR21_005214 [Pyricularia oryzae]KAI6478684.1 hypothetical protein MCOR18_006105 [Pyricularia oryzae]KAI6485507.1 hypothetical protein MCOR11_009639 [Pyricularia oryzae]
MIVRKRKETKSLRELSEKIDTKRRKLPLGGAVFDEKLSVVRLNRVPATASTHRAPVTGRDTSQSRRLSPKVQFNEAAICQVICNYNSKGSMAVAAGRRVLWCPAGIVISRSEREYITQSK